MMKRAQPRFLRLLLASNAELTSCLFYTSWTPRASAGERHLLQPAVRAVISSHSLYTKPRLQAAATIRLGRAIYAQANPVFLYALQHIVVLGWPAESAVCSKRRLLNACAEERVNIVQKTGRAGRQPPPIHVLLCLCALHVERKHDPPICGYG